MRRLEEIAAAYWAVGTALRHPNADSMTTGDALKALNTSERLRVDCITEVKLGSEMHTLTYDIIEGNTQWREKREARSLALILPMRR